MMIFFSLPVYQSLASGEEDKEGDVQYANNSGWIKEGWHSIWFMVGTTPVSLMTFSNISIEKLDTPTALTFLVSLEILTISFQVAATPGASRSIALVPSSLFGANSFPGLKATGQWIR